MQLAATGEPTPSLAHLTRLQRERVYDPAEDSFLLLDALEADRDDLRKTLGDNAPALCVEVGVGSGVVITFLARMLGPAHTYIGTDINPEAVEAASQTAHHNHVQVRIVQSDLVQRVQAIEPEVAGRVDVLVFNPPYVVTASDEVGGTGISAAWAGGADGREVLDRLLPQIDSLLSPRGRFYLLALEANIKNGQPDSLFGVLPGFKAEQVMKRHAGIERLSVFRYTRLA